MFQIAEKFLIDYNWFYQCYKITTM